VKYGFQINKHGLRTSGDEIFKMQIGSAKGHQECQKDARAVVEFAELLTSIDWTPTNILSPPIATPIQHPRRAKRNTEACVV
jgi:hypothetical protein